MPSKERSIGWLGGSIISAAFVIIVGMFSVIYDNITDADKVLRADWNAFVENDKVFKTQLSNSVDSLKQVATKHEAHLSSLVDDMRLVKAKLIGGN